MTTTEPLALKLVHTKAALARFDELRAKHDFPHDHWLPSWGDDDELGKAARAVGEAFALDTADRNNPDTARLVRPGPWLRGLVARFG